jgi:putative flippase GtrA
MNARPSIRSQFLRYLLVGGTGFLFDALGMEILVAQGWDVLQARAVSMVAAIAATYFLHRSFTFHDVSSLAASSLQRFTGYAACQLLAASLNYAIFALVLQKIMPQPPEAAARIFSLCAGVGAGLALNFLLLRYAVFSDDAGLWRRDLAGLKHFILQNKRLWVWSAVLCSVFLSYGYRYLDVLKWPGLSVVLTPTEPDVWMRLVKVRHWLSGAGFFDHAMPNANAPFGGVLTPWTRPMDFLIAGFSRIVPSVQGASIELNLLLGATWLPAALLLCGLFLLSRAGMRQFNHAHVLVTITLLFIFNPVTYTYFAPGFVDHHGLLTVLWCGVLCCLTRPLARMSSLIMGAVMGMMMWVSPETLVPIGSVFFALGCYAVFYRPAEMRWLALSSVVAAAVAALALFVEFPVEKILSEVHYDTLSIVYVLLLSLVAAGACFTAWVSGRANLPLRIFAAVFSAGITAAIMLGIFPRIFGGPMADVDPVIFNRMMSGIYELRSVAQLTPPQIFGRLFTVIVAIYLIVTVSRARSCPQRRRLLIVLPLLLLPPLVMTLYQVRWSYYLQPVAILTIGIFLPALTMRAKNLGMGWLKHFPRQARPHVFIWFLFSALALLSGAIGSKVTANNRESVILLEGACQSQMRYDIQTGALKGVLGPDVKVVFVHPNYASDMLFFTGYGLIAGNYHRENDGLRDVYDMVNRSSAQKARALLSKRKVDAIYICPDEYGEETWLYKLAKGEKPSWLKEVRGFKWESNIPDNGAYPRLYRVQR